MKGLTRSQLLEYVKTKRDAFYDLWQSYKANGDEITAGKMWSAYHELDSVYLCITDNKFSQVSYKEWTGKEI